MKPIVLVHGTWGRGQGWHRPGSALWAALEEREFEPFDFLWSGLLAGVPTTLPGDPAEATLGADEGTLLPWLELGRLATMKAQGGVSSEVKAKCAELSLELLVFLAKLGLKVVAPIPTIGPRHRSSSCSGRGRQK